MVRRVLVVDDSALFRTLLRRVLTSDPGLDVVGEASDGREAIEMAARLKPDVITMDIHMPVADGYEAIARIMESHPCPIVAVTGSLDPRDVKQTFRAIEAGAVAVERKPPGPTDPEFEAAVAKIVLTVKLMAEVKVVSRRRGRQPSPPRPVDPPLTHEVTSEIVAIGASTGGPAALEVILRHLPSDLPAPVVVVQHIAPGFERGLVAWLKTISPLKVKLASPDLPLVAGEVVVSVSERHLTVSRKKVVLEESGPVDGHCPSASKLFSSVASVWGAKAMGVILTGMGRDGARGLLELKNAGGYVVAQDRATSVVHGMPAAAQEAGAVDRVLPLGAIPAAIVDACDTGRNGASSSLPQRL